MKRRVPPSVEPESLGVPEVDVILAALAQPWRLRTFRLLVRYLPYGLAAGDIARLLALPHNTLSAHLAILEQAGLVHSRREGRSIIFVAARARALQLASFLTRDCCGEKEVLFAGAGGRVTVPVPAKREPGGTRKIYNVLILCTGNSARSILAEALLNREGGGRFRAYSAGSHPRRKPDPFALALLHELGYDVSQLRAKNWNTFAAEDAPVMDFVLTVCDAAAGEACPHWPGHPLTAHWGISDPLAVGGTESQKRAAITAAYRDLAARIAAFANLDVERLDLASLKRELASIAHLEGATSLALQRAA